MNQVRAIRLKHLTTCTQCSHVASCSRCPGLAYMEGSMLGPSSQDCEKSFARTGVPSANMLLKKRSAANLIQIQAAQPLPVAATA
jgi:AdoMet-dependent heme synthase